MVLEVGTRWVGFGKVRIKTSLEYVLTTFPTAIPIDTAQRSRPVPHGILYHYASRRIPQPVRCGFKTYVLSFSSTACRRPRFLHSTGEEVLDTILLVVRNAVQFWRLGTILRR